MNSTTVQFLPKVLELVREQLLQSNYRYIYLIDTPRVLAPVIAGSFAAFIDARQVFFLDALSFAIAAVLIFTLPGRLVVAQTQQPSITHAPY
ncbi:hypothetical protein [Nostoc sp. DSM 114161]|uniref:hypothetical protein n=1 Tax=Nostoc sp. DSM 114161 TaxID=3440143 RepID=UPI004045F5B4